MPKPILYLYKGGNTDSDFTKTCKICKCYTNFFILEIYTEFLIILFILLKMTQKILSLLVKTKII